MSADSSGDDLHRDWSAADQLATTRCESVVEADAVAASDCLAVGGGQ